ncbi:MAG TPA: metal-dependent phosphohydrolase [Acidimicrobiia bacterium]
MPIAIADVGELFAALQAARDADDEGGLSILDHGLQCADLLATRRPDDVELQVAGLVHDLGWLERASGGWQLRVDAAHDVDGRALTGPLLGARVARLVGGHVAAKRYLLTTDPSYRARLSARSEVTLAFQGGVMAADECRRFEQDPDGDDLVALRRADDDAKERGKVVPGLDRWRAVIERVVRDG